MPSMTITNRRAELHRQVERLAATDDARLAYDVLRELVLPLEPTLPQAEFILVLPGLVPAAELVSHVNLDGRVGFTSMEPEDLARFAPTADVAIPAGPAYVLVDPDTGAETLNVRPDDALPRILAGGRTPLTLEEGLALVLHRPEWLRDRNCFEMLGSRAGDKRVTGLWLSKRAPRLGWCWGGNPHTWLGMATAGSRLG